jgi:hypothetical protein
MVEPPSEMEQQMIIGLARAGADGPLGMAVDDPGRYRHMLVRGFVRVGTHEHRIVWSDSEEPQITQKIEHRVQLTELGRSFAKIWEHPASVPWWWKWWVRD